MKKYNTVSKEQFENLYIKQNKSYKEIANILNCSTSMVIYYRKKFNCHTRLDKSDLSNKIIGKLTIIEKNGYVGNSGDQHTMWKCQCSCGRLITISRRALLKDSKNEKSCGMCEWVGAISGRIWAKIVHKAAIRNLELSVTRQYIWDIFLKQNEKCALSGIKLKFAPDNTDNNVSLTTASLDRIDSSKGYIEGNLQWVHKKLNIMKSNMTDQQFIKWCNLVTNFNTKKE